MNQTTFKTNTKKLLADVLTPVAIYLKIRDVYPNAMLLEGADFKAGENQFSFIGMQPVAAFKAQANQVALTFPDGSKEQKTLSQPKEAVNLLSQFAQSFTSSNTVDVPVTGLFGYSGYEAVSYFEDITLQQSKAETQIPDLYFQFFKYIVAINHNTNRITLIEHLFNHENESQLSYIEDLLISRTFAIYPFTTVGDESSNITDETYKQMVAKGKEHCMRGDVFQIVLSRNFQQKYKGDEFNVYRALRSINPSPYMFYFDFGNFKLLGSSPESQIKTHDGKAYINPIAGTFKRTGHDQEDKVLAEKLATDPKENSEHIMLVDLARNDLSRNADNVKLNYFREIHYYSHVLHMVSEVQGDIRKDADPIRIFADTYPAGTLTGAPKIKAMELINTYENQARGFYGGSIGNIGFDGKINLAITIRSFLSKNNMLYYQAGAGIVADSSEENELHEVNNKLAALKQAIIEAQQI